MPGERRRGEEIRRFALRQAEEHPRDLVNVVAKQLHIGPQTARVHVQRLCSQKLLTEQGTTRDRVYSLRTLEDWQKTYPLALGMSEHHALDADVWPRLGDLPDNVRSIWSIAFTEMLNNVLDHASATEATIEIRKTAVNTEMVIHDNGVGIFKKIQQALKLTDERYAVVALSKGKFTTDPSKHRVKASSLRRKCLIVSTFCREGWRFRASQILNRNGSQKSSTAELRSG